MRWSKTFIPTMKEVPADAEIPSHQLMLRAGLIRQLMAGAYTYLPLGWKALRKAEAIVREEMEKAGAVELHMPAIQPIELFDRTERREAFGNVLINFEIPRRDHTVHLALGPTHEEVITDLISRHISSYRQLPLTLFQIQTKFRNEERPRFGVLRTSEFLMKDAYSFDATKEQLDASYQAMYDAYCRIFSRCGLEFLPVEAESGPIGGDASHEFMIPADNGEDVIVRCSKCDYAANLERADTGRTGSAIKTTADGPALEKVDTPHAGSIEAVSSMLKRSADQFIKTLIYNVTIAEESTPVAVLIRGDHEANENKIRRALEADAVELADDATIKDVTGAPVGFAGPVGLPARLIADHDIAGLTDAVTGANEGDTHYTGVVPGRDFEIPTTFDLRDAAAGDACPKCDGVLEQVHGIEVGHVFKLGTKYSDKLEARFLDENEQRHSIIMGCYGIGVNRIIAGLCETRFDDKGLLWPLAIAPYEVVVIPLNVKDDAVREAAEGIYADLMAAGVDAILDDRPARAGVKFNDADLIGFPLRVVIGGRGLKEGVVETRWREQEDSENIPLDGAAKKVEEMLADRREN